MALVIRLRQQGRKNRRSFRLVLADERAPRDGKYIEKLGWYNPFGEGEKEVFIDGEKVSHWVKMGARITDKAKALVKRAAPSAFKALIENK